MARPRREDRQRAAVLHLRHRGRHGVRHIARFLGLPKSTVSDWIRQGPDGILNPRLRIVAQAAVDRAQLAGAEAAWDDVRAAVLDEGGDSAWFAEDSEDSEAAGCGCCGACGPDCPGGCCDACQMAPVHTGAMVAFYLPADVAEVLALDPADVPGAEPPDELHLTLGYLGDADELDDPGRLARVVAGFAAIAPPVAGEISGVGRFSTGDRPVYASFDAPSLPEWRHRLVQHLRMAGYAPDQTHGFTPHVTLAYPDEGPVSLDVKPLEVTFSTLTLAIAGQRQDWPLEGQATLFAEQVKPESGGADAADRPRKPPEAPEDFTPAGQNTPDEPDTSANEAERIEEIEEPLTPILDRLHLDAMRRYVTGVANGAPHFRMLELARKIDPDFNLSDEDARRIIHALGRGDEPVKFAQAGRVPPPPYVRSVYDEFEFTEDQTAALAAYLFELAQEGYLEGINHNLTILGQPIATAIEDQDVLAMLRGETRRIAEGIADTYNRDLAREVYTEWIELRAERGSQMSRRWLEEAIERWATARAAWKAEQISLTELTRWWNRATDDFAERNAALLEAGEVNIEPGEAVCEDCLSLIEGNPYTPEEAAAIDLPLHPNCPHYKVYDWRPVSALDDLWFAQAA